MTWLREVALLLGWSVVACVGTAAALSALHAAGNGPPTTAAPAPPAVRVVPAFQPHPAR